jgi:LysR family glycine cleavage system transcriptional activator
MRKRLPPIFSLQVFEVAARHGKFSLAAQELHLTQSAVSRQIKQLEDWCERSLFSRHGPRVELTNAGQDLLSRLTAPLNALHAAVYSDSETEHQALHISTLASIASNLLLPSLDQFRQQYPDIHLSIQADYALASFPPQLAMVAIRYTSRADPNLQSHLLAGDKLVVVGTPAVVKRLGKNPSKWPAQQLLRHTNMDWSAWTSSQDLRSPLFVEGLEFNDALLLLDAAIRGMGIGLCRLSVAWKSLQNGELVLASDHICASPASYYLVYRPDCRDIPAVQDFTNWICEVATSWEQRHQQFGKKTAKKTLKAKP